MRFGRTKVFMIAPTTRWARNFTPRWQPQNTEAAELLADSFEQLGYQQENPGLRNSFLAAAYELRTGIPEGEAASSSGPDVDVSFLRIRHHT
jgi:alkyl sulfatase BDS1-like metallo-beta-lactamase superfamily hydrolase